VVVLRLTREDVARTRLAYSALWEAVTSFACLCLEEPPAVYRAWADRASAATAGLDLEPLRVLLGGCGYVPDFLLPVPDRVSPDLESELARVRKAPAEQVRAEARLAYPDGAPPALVPYLERPRQAVAALCTLLEAYWELALAPEWPRLQALLDGELLARAGRVSQHGPDALLDDLGPRIRWRAPVLEIDKKHDADVAPNGRGLLLVPVVFGEAVAYVSVDGPWTPAIAYAPRGVGLLWPRAPVAGREEAPLELLLGRSRAAVLRDLVRPASTSALALRLGLSPSTVSEHLAVLDRAGVVRRRRVGRSVLYGLNDRGERLVGLLAAGETTRTSVA
jgi:DNA-binding transcriptional ArsR family regulator